MLEEGKAGESSGKSFHGGHLCEGRLYVFMCCVPLCVRFLLCTILSLKHLTHFHLTRLLAYLLTYVFPMSPQAFMDFQV